MVPTTRSLLHHDGIKSSRGRSCYHHPGQYYVGIAAQLEDQSKPSTRSPRPLAAMVDDDEPAAAGTSSPGGGAAGDDEGNCWLQLGLAAATSSSGSSSSSGDNNITDPDPDPAPAPAPARPPPMEELYLFSYDNKRNARARPPLFPLPLTSYHQSCSYGRRGRYRPAAEASGSMSAPLTPPPFIRCSGAAIRVVSPPRRITEAAGLWLTLRAATNQIGEPVLPQIAKRYLRIKDSNVTVEVVVKYLADKLGIAPSHQVELTCRGQVLRPLLLVKYVRETIWFSPAPPREEQEAPPADPLTSRRSSAATDHVMTLCYSTSRNINLAPLNL